MPPSWNNKSAVLVLRCDNPKRLPMGIFTDEGAVMFLNDGAFLVDGGPFEKGDASRGIDALCDAFPHGHEPLAFHGDDRGVRWIKFAELLEEPRRQVRVPDFGEFSAVDVDYDHAVGCTGEWIAVEDAYARTAQRNAGDEPEEEEAPERGMSDLMNLISELPEEPETDEAEVKNVVVVIDPPERLPDSVTVLGRLDDETILLVGPRSKSWINELKRTAGPENLRLIRGPVLVSRLMEYDTFERLDASLKLFGMPMLVMGGS